MSDIIQEKTAVSIEKQQSETREEVHVGSVEDAVPEGADIALHWFEQVRAVPAAELEAESKRVRRKTDLILMPVICWTYALQYLDNTVLGYAYAFGLLEDTNMSEGDYNWLASIYYIGYLFVSSHSEFSEPIH